MIVRKISIGYRRFVSSLSACIRFFLTDKDYNGPISFGQVFLLAETHVELSLQSCEEFCEEFCFVFKARGGRIVNYVTNKQHRRRDKGQARCESYSIPVPKSHFLAREV